MLGGHAQPQQGELPVRDEQPTPIAGPVEARLERYQPPAPGGQAADGAAQAAEHGVETWRGAGASSSGRARREAELAPVDRRHRETILLLRGPGRRPPNALASARRWFSSTIARSRPSTRLHATPRSPTATSRATARMGSATGSACGPSQRNQDSSHSRSGAELGGRRRRLRPADRPSCRRSPARASAS